MDIADGNNVQLSTSMSFVEELLTVLISIQWSNKVNALCYSFFILRSRFEGSAEFLLYMQKRGNSKAVKSLLV